MNFEQKLFYLIAEAPAKYIYMRYLPIADVIPRLANNNKHRARYGCDFIAR